MSSTSVLLSLAVCFEKSWGSLLLLKLSQLDHCGLHFTEASKEPTGPLKSRSTQCQAQGSNDLFLLYGLVEVPNLGLIRAEISALSPTTQLCAFRNANTFSLFLRTRRTFSFLDLRINKTSSPAFWRSTFALSDFFYLISFLSSPFLPRFVNSCHSPSTHP